MPAKVERARPAPRAPSVGMSRIEVAEALGIPEKTLADIERRALRKLRLEAERRGLTLEDLFHDG